MFEQSNTNGPSKEEIRDFLASIESKEALYHAVNNLQEAREFLEDQGYDFAINSMTLSGLASDILNSGNLNLSDPNWGPKYANDFGEEF